MGKGTVPRGLFSEPFGREPVALKVVSSLGATCWQLFRRLALRGRTLPCSSSKRWTEAGTSPIYRSFDCAVICRVPWSHPSSRGHTNNNDRRIVELLCPC